MGDRRPRSRRGTLDRTAVLASLLALVASLVAASTAGAQDAPESAESSFTDVEGHWALDHIVGLEDEGTFGTECGEAMFCPSTPLKRETMAVWMVRVLDGSDPAPVTNTRFSDVDGSHRWTAHIERFAELGVTKGYTDGTFRPDVTVSRAHMASFLARAFDLPAAEPKAFGDVEGSGHEDNINRIAAVGITVGCGDGTNYCPSQQTVASRDGGVYQPSTQVRRLREGRARHRRPADPRGRFRCTYRQHYGLLGPQHFRAGRSARRDLQVCCHRPAPFVRAAHRRRCPVLGQQLSRQVGPTGGHLQGHSQLGGLSPVAYEATAPLPAGATTKTGKRTHPAVNSRPSPWGIAMRAESALTTPSRAGATEEGQADPPSGDFKTVVAGDDHTCGVRASELGVQRRRMEPYGGQARPPRGPSRPWLPATLTPVGSSPTTGSSAGGSTSSASLNHPAGPQDHRCTTTTPAGFGGTIAAGARVSTSIALPAAPSRSSTSTRPALAQCARRHCRLLGRKPLRPTIVPGLPFTAVAAGSNLVGFACGLRSNSTIDCWGDGSTMRPRRPKAPSSPSAPASITRAGCAPTTDCLLGREEG